MNKRKQITLDDLISLGWVLERDSVAYSHRVSLRKGHVCFSDSKEGYNGRDEAIDTVVRLAQNYIEATVTEQQEIIKGLYINYKHLPIGFSGYVVCWDVDIYLDGTAYLRDDATVKYQEKDAYGLHITRLKDGVRVENPDKMHWYYQNTQPKDKHNPQNKGSFTIPILNGAELIPPYWETA